MCVCVCVWEEVMLVRVFGVEVQSVESVSGFVVRWAASPCPRGASLASQRQARGACGTCDAHTVG